MKVAKQTSIADVVSVVTMIVAMVAVLGYCFAWATDPRPIEGSRQCRVSAMVKTEALPPGGWSAERDCKARFWSRK